MKKFMNLFAVVLVLGFISANQASAKKESAHSDSGMSSGGGSYDQDKGDGCGLGWQVTQKRTMLATTTRGTTNAFVPPTFGMTSGTIGCMQHDFAENEKEAASFVASNQDNLILEMAEGQGEYVNALAKTMGCDASAYSDFGRAVQQNYESIVGNSPVQMFNNIKDVMKADPALAAHCSAS